MIWKVFSSDLLVKVYCWVPRLIWKTYWKVCMYCCLEAKRGNWLEVKIEKEMLLERNEVNKFLSQKSNRMSQNQNSKDDFL